MPGIIVAEPEIRQFKVQKDHDFIIIGCDGIFDKLTNKEIIDLIWKNSKKSMGKGWSLSRSDKNEGFNVH